MMIARSDRRTLTARRPPLAEPDRRPGSSPFALALILTIVGLHPAIVSHPAAAAAVDTTSVYVPMRDGTRLAVDVHLPASRADGARLPALLELTRYWRASEDPATGVRRPLSNELDLYFLEHGYAVVKVDVRGSGASFGHRPIEYGPQEVRDGHDVVEWVVGQSWSNGRVGAYGTSYTGTTAELLAASGHPAVHAVIPGWSDFDVFRSPARPYGLMATGFIELWSGFVGLLDRNDPTAGGSVARVDADAAGDLLTAAVRQHAANPDVFEAVSRADFRDRAIGGELSLADASVMAWKEEIEASGVPMLVLASWLDAGTADGALLRLRHFTNSQKLVILASMHGGGAHASPYSVSGEPLPPLPSTEEQMRMRLRFFDHHLKGEKNGVEDWPTARYFNLGEEAFREAESWPPPGTRRRRYYLGAGRSLRTEAAPEPGGADRYSVDFSVSTGTANRWTTQMGEPVLGLDDRGAMDERMLTYTSPPLAEDLQITGTPVVTLFVRSNSDDGAFLVYLEDVDLEGRSRYVTEGGLRAMHRRLSTNPYFDQASPYHSFAGVDAEPLVPGEPAELVFRLWPTSVRVRAGHRLRLAIAGADADIFDRVPAAGEVAITVGWGEGGASFLELPVVVPQRSDRGRDGSRRHFLPDPPPLHSLALARATSLQRIAFGSCYAPQLETPAIWRTIVRERPQLLLLMGDNVYQSEEKVEPELRELRAAYQQLAAEPEFSELRAASAVLATWDDHDYGQNDAGAELPVREESERLFERVWPIAGPDPRRERPGVYLDRSYGPPGRRVQVVMLDTRFFRGPVPVGGKREPIPPIEDATGSGSTMLGEAQWRWFEERLSEPADLRILVSSIPVLSQRTEGESWHRLPLERERLFRLLRQRQAGGVLILSGDTHFGAHFQDESVLSSPLHEITSSSLNLPITPAGQAQLRLDDPKRVGAPTFEANFGLLEVDWQRRTVVWSIRGDSGQVLLQGTLAMGS